MKRTAWILVWAANMAGERAAGRLGGHNLVPGILRSSAACCNRSRDCEGGRTVFAIQEVFEDWSIVLCCLTLSHPPGE
jgi:hypothetical protein